MIQGQLPRLALAAALPLILSGCVVAVLPVAASALFANKQMGDVASIGPSDETTPALLTPEQRMAAIIPGTTTKSGLTPSARHPAIPPTTPPPSDAATPAIIRSAPRANPSAPAMQKTAAARSKPPAKLAADKARHKRRVAPASLAQSPLPTDGGPYAAFARYALNSARTPASGQERRSALVDQTTLTNAPKLTACADQPPAVLVDLDPGAGTFDLDNPQLPAPGLAHQLAALRRAGVTVMWSAGLPAAAEEKLYTILSASRLDPNRTDHLLLLRDPDERKQTRRFAAAHDWCILAIAGDRRADFDEVFDYLRDPEGPIAQILAANIGAGWFLAPPPID